MTGADATSMFEMITIEESEGSLVLHIQQWDPGFTPRTETAQKLELAEITENSVKFEDVSGFGMPTLGYSHPDSETFIIHVGQEDGSTFDIELKASKYLEVVFISMGFKAYPEIKRVGTL